ncbi:MAG TPA: DUF6230 family protein [Pseudonocardia sp.]|jgi:hypothetical protein
MQGEPIPGTRWGVFAAVLLPCAIVIAVLAGALLTGVMAASLAVSRLPVQLKVDKLVGQDLTLYASEVDPVGGDHEPAARAGIGEATISGLCLGLGADVPALGKVGVKATTPADVKATNLLLDARTLEGDLEARDALVGQDASAFTIGANGAKGPKGVPGLQARHVVLDNQVGVKVFSLMAGSLKLSHLHLEAVSGTTDPC